MNASSRAATTLSLDAWSLVFEELIDDYESLCNVGFTCRDWRVLSLPSLLRVVDISSHNNGRVPEHENEAVPVIYADHDAKYRKPNLIPRQRAFLRLITARPSLAKYIKSLTWTLVWRDFDEHNLTEIDRQTWNVFGEMTNVTHLDLASLHNVCDEVYVRKNPTRLFPAVTDLRLLGWMHRGLVKAIITSLESNKLRRLDLDCLQDEGVLPDGTLLNEFTAIESAYGMHAHESSYEPEPAVLTIDNDLFRLQEDGEACIFPGPNWLPLRLLSTDSIPSLQHLRIKLPAFDDSIDLRNYHAMFEGTVSLMKQARESLTSLVVIFGESCLAYPDYRPPDCDIDEYWLDVHREWCMKIADVFLNLLLETLSETSFPQLENIVFEGFHILLDADMSESEEAGLTGIWRKIWEGQFDKIQFLDVPRIDYRDNFFGYHDVKDTDLKKYAAAFDRGRGI